MRPSSLDERQANSKMVRCSCACALDRGRSDCESRAQGTSSRGRPLQHFHRAFVNMLMVKSPGPGPADNETSLTDAFGPEGGPGTLLDDRYLLSREIGSGSTGVVWDAQDLTNDEPVAVKVLHASLLSSPAARARFHREVRSAQALEHPNSVRVKAHGQTDDGGQFLVMERLRGRTLSALFADAAPLPQLRALRIVSQILDAMTAAHRENIVHRDLKPGNVILIDSGGNPDFVKVCDFGLAKVVDPEGTEDDDHWSVSEDNGAPITARHGDLCGTPEYMAPEQARGEPLDGRADLYSIAVILFQAVVGRVPFQGRTPFAIVGQHLGAPPPRPTSMRPDLEITPALENLILRGLAKDRRERPSSAEVFRAELGQIERDLMRDLRSRSHRRNAADAETLPARPDTSRRQRTVAARISLPAAVVVSLAGIALGTRWVPTSSRGKEPPPRTQLAAAPAPSGAHPTPPVGGTPAAATARPMAAVPAAAVADVAAVSGGHVAPPHPSRQPRQARLLHTRHTAARQASPVSAANGGPVAGLESPSVPLAPTASSATSTLAAPETEGPAGVVTDHPPDAEALLRRAEDLLADGQVAKACTAGETAIAAEPRSAAAHGFLGRCYTRVGRLDKARASYRAYLKLAPDAADAPFVRAIVDGQRR